MTPKPLEGADAEEQQIKDPHAMRFIWWDQKPHGLYFSVSASIIFSLKLDLTVESADKLPGVFMCSHVPRPTVRDLIN